MSPRIHLAPDTGAVVLPVGPEAVCVRHRAYVPPRTNEGCLHLTWEAFLDAPKRALEGRSVMVVVGLSRLATPSNRTKVGPLLWGHLPGVTRLVVDRTLFVAEPWRAVWHLLAVAGRYREYTYSYLAESHWEAAQEGRRDDPFTLEALCEGGRGLIQSHAPTFFEGFEVERVALGPEVHAAYQELKARSFEEEHTSAAIITRLAAFAAEHLPRRRLPTSARLFDARSHRVVQTDLRVDDWLVGRLRALVDLTNGLARAFA